MKNLRRFTTAFALAASVAGMMMLAPARVEAKGKGGGGDSAICQYLASVINYPYVDPAIQAYALWLFYSLGCDPALLK